MLLAMFMVTLDASAWKFTLNEPAEGQVEELSKIFLSFPGSMMDEWPCPGMQVVDEKGNTYAFSYNDMGAQAESVNGPITEPGTYTLNIAAGTYHVGGAANEEQSFTWTVGSSQGGGQQQGGNTEQDMGDFVFKYDKEADGLLTLTWAGQTEVGPTGSGSYYIDGYNGNITLNPYDSDFDMYPEQLRTYVNLPDGDYTLVISAGAFSINGVDNQLIEIPFTVGSSQGGGGSTIVELTGESFQFFDIEEIEFANPDEKKQGKDVGTFEKSGFSMTASQGSSNMFVPKYNYNQSFKGLVAYKGNTVTIVSDSHPILGVELIFQEGEAGKLSVDNGTYADGKWAAPESQTVTSATFSFNDRAVIEKIIVYTDEKIDNTDDNPSGGEGEEGDGEGDAPAIIDFYISYADETLTLTWPEGTTVAMGDVQPTLVGYSGDFELYENDDNTLYAMLTLQKGEYTLNIPANSILVNGEPIAPFSYPFTVGGNITGDPWNEAIFTSETWPSKADAPNPIAINTNGVKMTTVGTTYMGSEMNVGYSTNDTKELNWKNGTKLVFTPNGENTITKIIVVPTDDSKNALQYASASTGIYNNGVWTGEVAPGSNVTLTASDGINISKIVVCYNGDEGEGAGGDDDQPGTIIINWPENNYILNSIPYGDKVRYVTFTTNKEYAQVTVELKNNDIRWKKDDLPVRMVDNAGEKSDNLHVGENTIYITTPGEKAWYAYKEDSYTLVVKGYVHMWDAPEDYDAVAEINIIGNGVNHPPVSDYKLISFSPVTATDLDPFATRNKLTTARDNIITLEFDGPVASVTALTPGGYSGVDTKYTTAKANPEGTLWNITVPGGAIEDSEDGTPASLTIDVTAKDGDGAAIAFNYDRADFGISLMYDATRENVTEEDIKSLGTPAFSIVSGTQTVDASTESILMTFPQAKGFDGNMKVTVKGTFSCMDQSQPVTVDASGTMGQGIVIPVSLKDGYGYSLEITEIQMSETVTNDSGIQSEVIVSSFRGNWSTNFATGGSDIGGETDYGIMGEPTFTADAEGITISWPNADLSGINDCGININSINFSNATGWSYDVSFGDITDFTNGVKAEIPYSTFKDFDEDWNATPHKFQNGEQITVSIPVENLTVYSDFNNWGPAVYTNSAVITGTVNAVVEGGDEPVVVPSSVVIYEEGVDTHVSGTELNFVKDGVTLTSETTGSAYVVTNFKPTINNGHLRLFTYNTLHFSAPKNIKKIEFVPVVSTANFATKSLSSGEFANNTWTGDAENVDIIFSSTNIDILKIVVSFGTETSEEIPVGEQILGTPSIENISTGGDVVAVKFTYPDSKESQGQEKTGVEGIATALLEDGVKVAESTFGFQMEPSFFYGTVFNYTMDPAKAYTVVFEEGCWTINEETTIVEKSPKKEFVLSEGTPSGDGDDPVGETILKTPAFEALSTTGGVVAVKFTYPSSAEKSNHETKNNVEGTQTALYENGVKVAEGTFGFQMDPTFFYGTVFNYTVDPTNSYTVVFGEGCWNITDNSTGDILEKSPEKSYELVVSDDAGGGSEEGDDNGWKFSSVSPAEGEVESLETFHFGYGVGANYVNEQVTLSLTDADGTEVGKVMMSDNFDGVLGSIDGNPITEPGTYTLTIPAGTFTSWGTNLPNAEMTYTWTVIDNTTGGGADEFALVESYPVADQKLKNLYGETFKFVFNEPVKRVDFKVMDNTTGEAVTSKQASVAEASTTIEYTFDSGSASMYALSPAHEYSVEWTAYYYYNSMMSNEKAGEGSITIIGDDEDAPILSPNVEFVSIDHDPNTYVFSNNGGQTESVDLKLTFQGEGIVNSVEAWVQAAQMSTRPQQASISEDGKTVTVTVSLADAAGSGACAVFVRAKDADGHIIGGANEPVNPNNGYLQFSYASEIGLPAPSLVQNGQTVAQISELQFKNTEGISLNMDNSGKWNEIQILDESGAIVASGFGEWQFEGSGGGDESYTTMTLTLSDPIVMGGQYSVVLPYAAFVLGQEQSATLNGSKTYTITVDGSMEPKAPEYTVSPADNSSLASISKITIIFDEESSIGSGKITVKKDGEQVAQVEADAIWPESWSDPLVEFEINYSATQVGTYTFEIPEGYFQYESGFETLSYPAFTLTYTIDAATSINGLKAAINSGEKTYTISGQPVKTAKAGVYIINGRKVAVK